MQVFSGVDYVALGHLHGPQTLAENLRYSGSPLAYSFSEARHRKSVWLVELDAGGLVGVERLDDHLAREVASPGPSRHLRDEPEGPLGGPEVGDAEARVGGHDADEGPVRAGHRRAGDVVLGEEVHQLPHGHALGHREHVRHHHVAGQKVLPHGLVSTRFT